MKPDYQIKVSFIMNLNISAVFLELLGTFFIVFIGGIWTANAGFQSNGVVASRTFDYAVGGAFAQGLFAYIAADISGAFFNPSLTLGMALTKNLSIVTAIIYIIVQFLGSVGAGYAIQLMLDDERYGDLFSFYPKIRDVNDFHYKYFFYPELINSAFYGIAFYAVTYHFKNSPGIRSVVIGAVMFISALGIGQLTGSALNPAKTFFPGIIIGTEHDLPYKWWIYMVAPTIGYFFSSLIYSSWVKEKLMIGFTLENQNFEEEPSSEYAK